MGTWKRYAATTLAVGLAATAGCVPRGDSTPPPPSGTSSEPTQSPAGVPEGVTFGVWGTSQEIDAYRLAAEAYNQEHPESRVVVNTYEDADAVATAAREGEAPDVFLLSRDELSGLQSGEHVQPLGTLLDERNVEFGDGFFRGALEAFSSDSDLQCMPYGVYPQVAYVNTDLVDMAAMRDEGMDAPIDREGQTNHSRWSFEQYAAAAEFASRPRAHKGAHVDATLTGLAPFIYSGGGSVYDDEREPTSLSFASDDTRDVLSTVLPLLRDPTVTLNEQQLQRATPTEWFTRGRLGVLIDDRRLIPQLRNADGLDFDVWPVPRVDGAATVGEYVGACVSPGETDEVGRAVDFLVDLASQEQVRRVATYGYLQPARLDVAHSPAFLQPSLEPAHSDVFNASIRSMVSEPLLSQRDDLEEAVDPLLQELLLTPVLDLEEITERIDEVSLEVLSPEEAEESDGDSEEPDGQSETDSDSGSDSGSGSD